MTALSNNFHWKIPGLLNPNSQTTTDSVLMGVGSRLYPLPGIAAQMPSNDYISLAANSEPDLLTYFLKTYCSRWFRTRSAVLPTSSQLSHLAPQQLSHYSLHYLNITTSFLTTILSALLLFLPIYILYHVSSSRPGLTLGLIALFTALFAGTVALVTNASKAEIFGSCAAYAAVLVVFVSGGFAAGSPPA